MRKLSVCLNQEINSGHTANVEKPPLQKKAKNESHSVFNKDKMSVQRGPGSRSYPSIHKGHVWCGKSVGTAKLYN
jgi:hypothetical protein